jgi:hypothetical protein
MRKMDLFAVLGLSVLAQSVFGQGENTGNPPPVKRFSIEWSAGLNFQPDVFGRTGQLGFSFLVFRTDKIDIRNHLMWYTGVLNWEKEGKKDYGQSIIDKISVGSRSYNGLFRSYAFLDGGVGIWGERQLETFENGGILGNAGIGFGLDLFPKEWLSFFTEFGLRGIIYGGEFTPQHRFELGVRTHF